MYFPVVQASRLGGLDVQEESWLMSSEGKDRTYRPAKKASRGSERESYRTMRREVVDYTEVDTIDLDTSGEQTIVDSESGFGSEQCFKQEPVEDQGNGREGFLGSVGFQDDWTPNTLRQTASKVTQQFERLSQVNTELTMARESEKSSVEKLMEMMLSMKMDEQKRDDERRREERQRDEDRKREEREREDRRERERREEKEERLAREERLITTLKAAQPAIPQKVTINSNRLPAMKEGEDIEVFLPQLRAALVSLNIPVDDWKGYIYSQVTTTAKDHIMHLLSDEDASYDDVERGLLGIASMLFANAAEALFTPMTVERSKLSSRKLIK